MWHHLSDFNTSLLGSQAGQIKSLEEALQITYSALVELFSTVPIKRPVNSLSHLFAAVGLSLSNSLTSPSSDIEQDF